MFGGKGCGAGGPRMSQDQRMNLIEDNMGLMPMMMEQRLDRHDRPMPAPGEDPAMFPDRTRWLPRRPITQ